MEGSGRIDLNPLPAQSNPALGWRAIVLIEFPCISLFAKFKKRLHLFFHELSASFFAQVDLILVNNHDPHAFPFFPAGFADLGLDLGFEPPHKKGISDNFSGLSTRDALDVCHDERVLLHMRFDECSEEIVTLWSCQGKRRAD